MEAKVGRVMRAGGKGRGRTVVVEVQHVALAVFFGEVGLVAPAECRTGSRQAESEEWEDGGRGASGGPGEVTDRQTRARVRTEGEGASLR